jgi:hypothetical protein
MNGRIGAPLRLIPGEADRRNSSGVFDVSLIRLRHDA